LPVDTFSRAMHWIQPLSTAAHVTRFDSTIDRSMHPSIQQATYPVKDRELLRDCCLPTRPQPDRPAPPAVASTATPVMQSINAVDRSSILMVRSIISKSPAHLPFLAHHSSLTSETQPTQRVSEATRPDRINPSPSIESHTLFFFLFLPHSSPVARLA
jgi:hypothetical protein